jgi:hypothetical protein
VFFIGLIGFNSRETLGDNDKAGRWFISGSFILLTSYIPPLSY